MLLSQTRNVLILCVFFFCFFANLGVGLNLGPLLSKWPVTPTEPNFYSIIIYNFLFYLRL